MICIMPCYYFVVGRFHNCSVDLAIIACKLGLILSWCNFGRHSFAADADHTQNCFITTHSSHF